MNLLTSLPSLVVRVVVENDEAATPMGEKFGD